MNLATATSWSWSTGRLVGRFRVLVAGFLPAWARGSQNGVCIVVRPACDSRKRTRRAARTRDVGVRAHWGAALAQPQRRKRARRDSRALLHLVGLGAVADEEGVPRQRSGPQRPSAAAVCSQKLGFNSASSSIYSAGVALRAATAARNRRLLAQITKPFRAFWSVALFRPSSCCSTLAGRYVRGQLRRPDRALIRSSCRSRPCRSACESQWACLPLGSSVSANAGIGTVHREGIDEGGVARARARGSAEGPCVVRKSG